MGITINIAKLQLPHIVTNTPAIWQEWNDLTLSSDNLYAFYQSPAWWDYSTKANLKDHILRLRFGERHVIVQVNDNNGKLAGMSGAFATNHVLHFMLKSRSLLHYTIPVVSLMGGQPLIVNNEDIYVEFVKSLFEAFPDCSAIHIPGVPINSQCWNILNKSKELQSLAKAYVPNKDFTKHYSITLDKSFDDYLLKFSKKARYNLKREIRILNNSCSDQLSLVRIEQAKDVRMFLAAAAMVSSRSWQQTLEPQMENSPDECLRYEQFANQGVLRCYLLKCGETPCVFVRGFQFGEVFYYSRTGFDQAFSEYSSGRAMFYLLLEDLYAYRSPSRLNFQEGEYEYKRHFATEYVEKADLLLIRNNIDIISKLTISMHNKFGEGICLAKRLLH